MKQRYKETIDVDVQKGIVTILDEAKLENTKADLQWYVPHLAVLNPNKPDKVRRVCNAASKFGGVSLKDNLMAGGPDLQQSLIGVIFRFREKQIGLTADVEAMFLHVKVLPTACNVLRFVWRENHTDPIFVYGYGRHIFGAKSSPTCVNYALQQVRRDSRVDNEYGCNFDLQKFLYGREVSTFRSRSCGSVQELAKVLSRWWIPTNDMVLQLKESNGKNISWRQISRTKQNIRS